MTTRKCEYLKTSEERKIRKAQSTRTANLTHELSHDSAHENAHGSVHKDFHGNAHESWGLLSSVQNARSPHKGSHDSAHGKFESAHENVHESVLSQFSHVLFLAQKSSLNMKFLSGISRGRLGGYPGGRSGPKTFTTSLGVQETIVSCADVPDPNVRMSMTQGGLRKTLIKIMQENIGLIFRSLSSSRKLQRDREGECTIPAKIITQNLINNKYYKATHFVIVAKTLFI